MDNKKNSLPYALAVLVLVALVIGAGIVIISNNNQTEPENTTNNSNTERELEITEPRDEVPNELPIENDTEEVVLPNEDTTEAPPNDPATSGLVLIYENGTYSANGNYTSPAGQEEVSVNLTVENDVVTAVTVTPMATNPGSVKNQTAFSEGISDVIVGKSLAEISDPGVVNGSSLTGDGFAMAVEQIRVDALI